MQIPGYRIVRKIDQGGMSTVYLAIQLSVGREVALKVMSPALNADPVFSKRFQREANIVGQLSYPHIVSIYDIGCHKNLNYIAMDYLPGGTIHDRIKSELSVSETLRIIKEVARALDVAHSKGYVHRDIKPENVLFREDGTAVLSDFGVAKAISAASQTTNAGLVVGTPHYMSPEQSRGLAIDGRSDIYSLGIVFYEMLTGNVPYNAAEAVAIAIKHITAPVPTLPVQFTIYQAVLNRFLAKGPEDRFQFGKEIVEAIEQVEDTLAGNAHRRHSTADPNNMNVMTLFKALVLTSYSVLKIKTNNFIEKTWGWRWTPKRGFYHHPKTKVTEIKTNIGSDEENRVTVVSTSIRNAAHYQDLPNRKISVVTRIFMFAFVCGIIWSAISVGLVRFNLVTKSDSSNLLIGTFVSTADVIDHYFGHYTDSPTLKDTNIQTNTSLSDTSLSDTYQSKSSLSDISQPRVSPIENNDIKNGAGSIQQTLSRPNNARDIVTASNEINSDANATQNRPGDSPNVFYTLRIQTTPEQALIRILNIREKYQPNIRLSPGRYHIEASHPGFHTKLQWISINDQDHIEEVNLQQRYEVGESIVHTLVDNSSAPEMVVLPMGVFIMGSNNNADTSPEHEVGINNSIAASKYEVTFFDYDKFSSATGNALPSDKKWGRGNRPAINITWQEANEYAQWLSDQTGKTYRLPSESEWEFFARADSVDEYWWGNPDAEGKANCNRGCKSKFTGVFSKKSAPVGNYEANAFGLHDTAGNVAEWTADCYQDHYIGSTNNGSPLILHSCNLRSVRGGSMRSNAQNIKSYIREGISPDARADNIGFRLVLELP